VIVGTGAQILVGGEKREKKEEQRRGRNEKNNRGKRHALS